MFIRRRGVYFGQCSELCGINHAFMPIVIEAVTFDDFRKWILTKTQIVNKILPPGLEPRKFKFWV